MLEKLVDIVKRIPKVTEAMGINLGVEDDGKTVTLDIAGNKVNAVIDSGKLSKISVDFNDNPKKALDDITKAITGEDCVKSLDEYPTVAEVNPEYTIAVSTYGEEFLYGGYVTVAAMVTDYDKDFEFEKENKHWTQYIGEDALFSIVKKLFGFDDKSKKTSVNLIELFTGKYSLGSDDTKVSKTASVSKDELAYITRLYNGWCDVVVYSYYPKTVNRVGFRNHKSTGYNWKTAYEDMLHRHDIEHGLMIGMSPTITQTLIEQQLAGMDQKFNSVDVRENGPARVYDSSLKIADTIARFAYDAQLADISNTHNLIPMPDLAPSEKDSRDYYDKHLKDMEYDKREQIVKLEYVNWD